MMRRTLFPPFSFALLFGAVAACSPAAPPIAPQFHAFRESPAPLDTSPSDMAVLNRVSWGAETADAQLLAAIGLQSYLTAQLSPPADDGLPAEARAQIAAMEISQKSVVQINQNVRAL